MEPHSERVRCLKKAFKIDLFYASLFYYNAEHNVYSVHYRKYLKNSIITMQTQVESSSVQISDNCLFSGITKLIVYLYSYMCISCVSMITQL